VVVAVSTRVVVVIVLILRPWGAPLRWKTTLGPPL
jgi:hypothetical protein